jgi:D-xylose reductase
LQRGVSLIPKSSRPERLKQNLELFSFELDAEDMHAIAELDRGRRYNDPGVFAEGMGASLPIYD